MEDFEALWGQLPAGKDEKMAWKNELEGLLDDWVGRIAQEEIDILGYYCQPRAWYNKKGVEMEGLDVNLFLENQLIDIDEMLVLLRDERTRYSAAFGKLITERQNAVSVLNG